VEENDDMDGHEAQRPLLHSRYESIHRLQAQPFQRNTIKPEMPPQLPQLDIVDNPVLALSDAVAALEPQFYPDQTIQPSSSEPRQSILDERVVYGDESRIRRAVTDNIVSWVDIDGKFTRS
jgi:hypothetical protein